MANLILYADTERSAAMRHEVPLTIIDPFMLADLGGRRVVLTSILERDRIAAVLPDAEVLDAFELGLRELITESGLSRPAATREVVVRALEARGVREAIVPDDFPLALADRLRAADIAITVDEDAVAARRRAKSPAELQGVRAAQRAAHAGMAAAAAVLAEAAPGADGRLHRNGRELHAEDVRAALRTACAELGAPCPPDVMVTSLWSGMGHEPGRGPLPAGLPIQIDLWPRDEATGCWADMTRTFIVGQPTAEHRELIAAQEALVGAALAEATAGVRPGVTGRELFDRTCDTFEAAGHRTQRTGPGDDPADGFQFSLGHGVGLEIHEDPILGLAGTAPLVPGDVVAVEPGLWDRRIGGVRFEDLLLVTEDGCERLTDFPYTLDPRAATK